MSAYTAAIATAIRKGACVLTGDEAADLERDLIELHSDRARLAEAVALLRRVLTVQEFGLDDHGYDEATVDHDARAFLARAATKEIA